MTIPQERISERVGDQLVEIRVPSGGERDHDCGAGRSLARVGAHRRSQMRQPVTSWKRIEIGQVLVSKLQESFEAGLPRLLLWQLHTVKRWRPRPSWRTSSPPISSTSALAKKKVKPQTSGEKR